MDPDSNSPTEPPPPAYDAQEFDRKISTALEMSMDPTLQTVLEEEWEVWDEETHNANAARIHRQPSTRSTGNPISRQSSKKSSYSAHSPRSESSSSTSTYYSSSSVSSWAPGPPSSRRLPSSPPVPKERPSWYKEAHLHLPATSDVSRTTRSATSPMAYHIVPQTDDEYQDNVDEPLPPFVPVGPPLEGPPYSSPTATTFSSSSYYTSPPRSPPPQRRSVDRPSFRQRPVASSPPLSTSGTYSSGSHLPPMPFDPGLAYARQRQVSAFMSRDEDSGPVDPSLLYNSAVASVMKKSKSMQPLKKPATNRDRSIEPNQQPNYDTRSYAESYQGSSHLPRVTQYAVPSLPTQSLHNFQPHSALPPSLPTLATLPVDDHQADSRSISSYYMHPNPSQWSHAASSYGYGRA